MMIQPSNKGFAAQVGFTSDKFEPWSYLWRKGNEVWISAVQAKIRGVGSFSTLLRNLQERKYTIKIPTPIGFDKAKLKATGFEYTVEVTPDEDGCEVYVWRPK